MRPTCKPAGSTPAGGSSPSAARGRGWGNSGGPRRSEGMDRKRPSRFRYTLRYGIAAAVVIVILLNLFYPRESNVVPVGYGSFKQILQAPGAHFQNVRVGPAAIRGEVTFTDRVSGLPDAAPAPPATLAFRTSRQGITDDKLFELLDRYAPGYEAEADKSAGAVLME